MTFFVMQLLTNNLATLHAPRNQTLDVLVVPNTVEDKHVERGQALPRAVEDLGCIELVLS